MSQSDSMVYRLITSRKRLILFLFAFSILAISIMFFALSAGKPFMGTVLSMNDGSWAVESVDTNGLAAQAGIRAGNSPIEINNQPAQTFLEKYEKAGTVIGILINELTVIDDSGQMKSVALKDSSPPLESLIELITWFVVSITFWITGFYVFFKRPRNRAALLLYLLALVFGLALSGTAAAERTIPAALQLSVIASVIAPWLLLHFFLVLPEERTKLRNNTLVYLIYLPAAITLILFPLIGYADGQPVEWFRTARLLEYGVGFLAAVGVAFFNYFHAISPRTRQQMKIVVAGSFAALIPFLILSVIPEVIWEQTIIPPEYSILLTVFIPLSMGYAVITQKLMDIDVVIRRGVIYGLITLVMAAILSTALFTVVAFHESFGVPEEIALALALGAIASILFGPIKRRIEALVDRLFYKDRYDYRQMIQSLSTSLNSVNEITGVSRLVVGTTAHALNLAGGCLFVKAQDGTLQVSAVCGGLTDTGKQRLILELISQRNQNIEFPNSAPIIFSDLAFIIPLMAGEEEVGVLCLCRKTSRQDFSSDDMYLLQGVCSVAAMALHSALLVRDISIRDTFVSVASHELRTPLTSVQGYADLLMRRDPPEAKRKQWLKNILDNSNRVSVMVDDLLNVSRIQSGKTTIKRDRIGMSDIFNEILSLPKESSNKHEFIVEMESDLPEVVVDRDKFIHVVGNLLSNAVKYSPNGGRITLSAHNDKEQHRIVVSVADEGIGIGPADKDLLFTTFHRIQRPETRGIRGSGLGLYIAKEWTEAMGGKIWVESKLNKGSTFFVAIPTQDFSGTG